jgi:hypothetical protein
MRQLFGIRGLARFIEQDGYFEKHDGVILFCTECYTLAECQRLIVLLKEMGIKAGTKKRGNGYRIRVSRLSMSYLIETVRPHIHPRFMYKLGVVL